MQKIGIALPSCIRQRRTASLAGMMVVGWFERPKQVILPKRPGAPDTERNAQCEATVWTRPGASGRSGAQHSTIVKDVLQLCSRAEGRGR